MEFEKWYEASNIKEADNLKVSLGRAFEAGQNYAENLSEDELDAAYEEGFSEGYEEGVIDGAKEIE